MFCTLVPSDFGPIYAETNLCRFIAEPWNTVSNLIFLALAFYFAWKTRLNFRDHRLIVLSLPILLLGFIGGTIYHATRAHQIWLFLDFLPILVLAFAGSLSLWCRLCNNLVRGVIVSSVAFMMLRTVAHSLPRSQMITCNYAGLAVLLLLPALLLARRNNRGVFFVVAAAVSFSAALFFRSYDKAFATTLPFGTHFLWHLFGGMAVYFLIHFIYTDDRLSFLAFQKISGAAKHSI